MRNNEKYKKKIMRKKPGVFVKKPTVYLCKIIRQVRDSNPRVHFSVPNQAAKGPARMILQSGSLDKRMSQAR